MTNKRIIRFALGILSLGEGEIKTPSDAYTQVKHQKNLDDFYQAMGPDNFIKVCIAVWCLSRGYNQSQIEDVFDKVFFATLFTTEGKTHTEDCDQCGGGGTSQCDICNGHGNIECDFCDGSGEITCDECDGDGQIEQDEEGNTEKCDECDGKGTMDCNRCAGDGDVTCQECDGSGEIYCDECDGDGEITTDDWDYQIMYVVCWNKKLQEEMELKEQEVAPLLEDTSWEYWSDYYITLAIDEEFAEVDEFVETDEIYVLEVFPNRPQTNFNVGRGYTFTTPRWNIDHLIK